MPTQPPNFGGPHAIGDWQYWLFTPPNPGGIPATSANTAPPILHPTWGPTPGTYPASSNPFNFRGPGLTPNPKAFPGGYTGPGSGKLPVPAGVQTTTPTPMFNLAPTAATAGSLGNGLLNMAMLRGQNPPLAQGGRATPGSGQQAAASPWVSLPFGSQFFQPGRFWGMNS